MERLNEKIAEMEAEIGTSLHQQSIEVVHTTIQTAFQFVWSRLTDIIFARNTYSSVDRETQGATREGQESHRTWAP